MIKKIVYIILFTLISVAQAQTVQEYFDQSANAYVQNENEKALAAVKSGLLEYPTNEKLNQLKSLIETRQEQEKQNKKKNQGQQDGEKSEQPPDENDNQNQSGQQDGRNQGEKGSGSNQEKIQSGDQQMNDDSEAMNKRLEEYRQNQLLEALKQQEQNTQRKILMGKTKKTFFRNEKDW